MSEQPNNGPIWLAGAIAVALVGGIVGLMFKGSEQTARNHANDIGGIDALEVRVEKAEGEIKELASDTLGREELGNTIDGIEKTIIRRFNEDANSPIQEVKEDAEKNEDSIHDLSQRLSKLEGKLEILLNGLREGLGRPRDP